MIHIGPKPVQERAGEFLERALFDACDEQCVRMTFDRLLDTATQACRGSFQDRQASGPIPPIIGAQEFVGCRSKARRRLCKDAGDFELGLIDEVDAKQSAAADH